MDFLKSLGTSLTGAVSSLGNAASSGVASAKAAVSGTPASVGDGYPPMGARRRGKKTKKAGRRKKRTMRWF